MVPTRARDGDEQCLFVRSDRLFYKLNFCTMDFLGLKDKHIILTGIANRRSIAAAVAKTLREAGADLLYVFKDEALRDKNLPLLGDNPRCAICNVAREEEMENLRTAVQNWAPQVDGLVHSIAFANYSEGIKPYHDTLKADFLQAVDISCFSLTSLCHHLQSTFSREASIVTLSISTTRMASTSYGYMGPIKAALDSSVVFLAKSLTERLSPDIRVNAVGASPLKTSASAGIPGYIDSYLYAEKATLRHRALQTEEAANIVAFLLSPRSSGINAQTIIADAGMSCNYFDDSLVRPSAGK